MIYCADHFLGGGSLKLYKKLSLESYDMLCWGGFLEGAKGGGLI